MKPFINYCRIGLSTLIIFLMCNETFSQQPSNVYISTKESLLKRPTPQWFNDAKFGIFIHLGLYSVPAWATPTRVNSNR